MLTLMARPKTHDEAVRQRLLEAASSAIGAGGRSALSVRAVAEEAGTTTAAVYSLFGSREALIEAVVNEGFRRFASHLETVNRSDDPALDLIALGVAYRANAVRNPHFYRVMFGPVADSGSRNRGEGTFALLVAAVARAGECEGAEARRRAERLWAYVHGLVSLELSGLAESYSGDGDAEAAYVSALRAAAPLVRTQA